jgi:hypothetical protein
MTLLCSQVFLQVYDGVFKLIFLRLIKVGLKNAVSLRPLMKGIASKASKKQLTELENCL